MHIIILLDAWAISFPIALSPALSHASVTRACPTDRWNVSVGGSYAVSSVVTLDAAANYVDFKNASVDRPTAAFVGTPVQTGILTPGELQKARALVLSLGGAVHF